MQHRRSAAVPVVVLALSLALAGCGDGGRTAAVAPAPPPAVTVVKIAQEELRPTITFTGRIAATDKVELRARVDGFLDERRFTEGAKVKQGDVLFVIEKAPYEAAVAEAKALIAKAQAELDLANIEVERQSTLVSKDVAAKARLDQATANQGSAQGEVDQQKAALTQAELNLSYTDVTAPLAGRIGAATFSVGSFVGPSSGTLATLVAQDPIYATFPVTQRQILDLRKAQGGKIDPTEAVIYLQLADGSRYPQPGKINFVDVTVNQGTDTLTVRASFPNPDGFLVDGQLVTVVAETGKPETVLTVPQQAIQVDQAGAFVLVVNAESKVEARRIEAGRSDGTRLVVTKGLTAGEQVITEGIQKVRPGQVVNAAEAPPPAA
jgi:membrane fusion protein (multidrug efflux system)